MKIGAVPKKTECGNGEICGYLEAAITGVDGRNRGVNSYRFLNINTGKDFYKYALVFKPRPRKDEYGELTINFCPFCGARFEDGRPA